MTEMFFTYQYMYIITGWSDSFYDRCFLLINTCISLQGGQILSMTEKFFTYQYMYIITGWSDSFYDRDVFSLSIHVYNYRVVRFFL